MNYWLAPAGIVGVGAIIAASVASVGAPEPEVPPTTIPTPPVTRPVPKPTPAPVDASVQDAPPLVPKTKEPPAVPKRVTSSCHPSYSGCLEMNVGDYDCASGSGNGPNYTGAVQVYGSDPFDLDRDNDGWGCE